MITLLSAIGGVFLIYAALDLSIYGRAAWFPDRFTGRYPPLRVVWNILTAVPLYISIVVAVVFVFLHRGLDVAKYFWRDNS